IFIACTLPPSLFAGPRTLRPFVHRAEDPARRPGSSALYVMRPASRRPGAMFPLPVEASAAGRLVLLGLRLLPLVAAASRVDSLALRLVVARHDGLFHATHHVSGVLGGPDHTHPTPLGKGPAHIAAPPPPPRDPPPS